MSRGVYRGIYSALPDDPDFQALSSDARLTLLVARICHQAGPAAIFRYYPELLRLQTGLTAKRLDAALVELERLNWIYREGVVLWIRNGLRHDPNTTLANDNHRKAVLKHLAGLPKCPLVLRFCHYYELPIPSGWDQKAIERGIESKDPESESDTESDTDPDTTAPPPAAPAPAAVPSWGQPEQLVALYNRLAPNGHPRVTRLSPGRKAKARAYLTAFPEQTFWTGVFSEIALSKFLQYGSRDSPAFRGDFDWLLTKGKDGSENAVKVYEGKYRDKEQA